MQSADCTPCNRLHTRRIEQKTCDEAEIRAEMRSEWMGLLVVAVLLVLVTPYLAFHGAIFGHEHGVHLAVVTTPVHHLPQVRRARALSIAGGARA